MSDSKPDDVVEKVAEAAASAEAEQARPEAAQAAPVDEASPLAELQAQLEAAQAKADANWDVALRTKAEMENLKRRTDKEISNARKFALEKLANELLAVRDSMEMGLHAARDEGADIARILEGSELTLKMLADVMAKFNIEQLDPLGEAFNPEHHQAVAMQPAEGQQDNTVMEVMQKGYLLNERLLRPAMVVVVKN